MKVFRTLSLVVVLAAPLLPSCRSVAGDAHVATDPDDYAASLETWHAKRIEKLTAEDGWLSLVALAWLEPGANRVGSASDAAVSYAGLPAPHVGTLHVEAGATRFEAAPGVDVEGVPADGRMRTDAEGAPTVLRLGEIRFHVVERGGRLAVRMKDAQAPTRTGFAGIERFPPALEWRVLADFDPAPPSAKLGLDTVIGATAEVEVTGRVRFAHGDEHVDAVLYSSGDGGSLLRFSDATSGRETYGIGRYLRVEAPTDGSTVVLDFNRAYNPPCAFTAFATCTLPPPENRLPFAVEAGEKSPAVH